jgi:hypothetical protein
MCTGAVEQGKDKIMKKLALFIHILLLVGLSVNCREASGEIVAVEVEGTVRSIDTYGGLTFDDTVDIGTIMTGLFTYDTDSSNLSVYDAIKKHAIVSVSVTIGELTFRENPQSSEPGLFRINSADPGYIVSSSNVVFNGTVYVNGLPKNYQDIPWSWSYLEVINVGTSSFENIPLSGLPDAASFPAISIFDVRKEFWVCLTEPYFGQGAGFSIRGELTSLAVIPEPATLVLLGLGSVMLLRKRSH